MINKESEILHYFAKEPWKEYTFTGLLKTSKKKSRSYLAAALSKFVSGSIIKQRAVGHLPVYSLNTASAKARAFAGFVLEYHGWNKKHIPYDDLQKIIEKMPVKDYIFIIAGSYASNKQKAESDIDIVILIDDSAESKKIYAELSHYCEINIPPLHLYVFKNKEYIEMLCNKEANYGKEIAKNNLILAGGQIYIKLIDEAIQNGFND
jgi:predicted nucleotidyltransferase